MRLFSGAAKTGAGRNPTATDTLHAYSGFATCQRYGSMSRRTAWKVRLAGTSVAILFSGAAFGGGVINAPGPGIFVLVAAGVVGAIVIARLRK